MTKPDSFHKEKGSALKKGQPGRKKGVESFFPKEETELFPFFEEEENRVCSPGTIQGIIPPTKIEGG